MVEVWTMEDEGREDLNLRPRVTEKMTGTESADEFLKISLKVIQNLVIIYKSCFLHPQKTNMDTQNDGFGSSIGSTCDRQEAS